MSKETMRETIKTIKDLNSMKAVKVAFDLSQTNMDSITKVTEVISLIDNNLNKTVKYDEQLYTESKFSYKIDSLGGLYNSAIYIIKHKDYDIEEIIDQ